jgi:transposase-like protein
MGRQHAKPSKLLMTETQYCAIKKISNHPKTTVKTAKRAKMLQLGYENKPHSIVSQELGVSINTIKLWRNRWDENQANFSDYDTETELICGLHQFFKDLPRSGVPPKFTEAQRKQIIALACDEPSIHDIPMTNWSSEMLALTAKAKGIVESISSAQVRRILKNGVVTTS